MNMATKATALFCSQMKTFLLSNSLSINKMIECMPDHLWKLGKKYHVCTYIIIWLGVCWREGIAKVHFC